MENASKALLIAGGILIAMLIISIGIYLFINYSTVGETYDRRLQATEIQKFNENFTRYEGRKDVTIQEIVTLYSYVKEYEGKTGDVINIKGISGLELDNPAEAITNHQGELFSLEINSYDSSGMVNSITIR